MQFSVKPLLKQEYIPVGCVPPDIYRTRGRGFSLTEAPLAWDPPWIKTPLLDRKHPQTETPWTDTPPWTDSQTGVKTLPFRNFSTEYSFQIMDFYPKLRGCPLPRLPPPRVDKDAPSGFETHRRRHQKFKTGYQWPHKNRTDANQKFKKKQWRIQDFRYMLHVPWDSPLVWHLPTSFLKSWIRHCLFSHQVKRNDNWINLNLSIKRV